MTLKFQMCFIKCLKFTLRNIGEGIEQTLLFMFICKDVDTPFLNVNLHINQKRSMPHSSNHFLSCSLKIEFKLLFTIFYLHIFDKQNSNNI